MAVYTRFTDAQLAEIGGVLGREIVSVHDVEEGTNNSVFRAVFQDGHPDIALVIFETPVANTSMCISRLVRHIAQQLQQDKIKTKDGKDVAVIIPEPYLFGEDPGCIMEFGNVRKTVVAFPFYEGKKSRDITPEFCFEAGAALAVFHKAGQCYNAVGEMQEVFNADKCFTLLGAFSEKSKELRLGKDHESGRELIQGLLGEAEYIKENWSRATHNLPRGIIHGDFCPDNTIRREDGRLVVFDFGGVGKGVLGLDIGKALNDWATENGKPIKAKVAALLKGYDAVLGVSPELEAKVPFLARAASIQWAPMRIKRAAETKAQGKVYSPAESMALCMEWRMVDKISGFITPRNSSLSLT